MRTKEAVAHSSLIPCGWIRSQIAATNDDTRPPICKKNEDTERSDARFSDGMLLLSKYGNTDIGISVQMTMK
jgi:hypothetical protein